MTEPTRAQPITDEDRDWLEFSRKVRQEQSKRLEDAAKFLSGMISISLTIVLKTDETTAKVIAKPSLPLSICIGCWLVSLILSFFVVFPLRYRFSHQSAQSFRESFQKVVSTKFWLLLMSTILFVSALTILSYLFYDKNQRNQLGQSTSISSFNRGSPTHKATTNPK